MDAAPDRMGDPDLQGIYNYATLTPVERPANFASKAVLTEEEAAAYEQQNIQRQEANTTITAGADWWDPGTRHLINRRTSLVVDPPNGRIPPLTPQGQTASRRGRGATTTDGPEDLGLNVRCLQYPTAGPPMLPGMYNVDVQFVQTKASSINKIYSQKFLAYTAERGRATNAAAEGCAPVAASG